MQKPDELIKNLAQQGLENAEQGKLAEAKKYFSALHTIIEEFPHILWKDPEVYMLGKAYLVMYHIDLFDDEETNIALAHLALLFTKRGIQLLLESNIMQSETGGSIVFDAMKNEIVIYKSCEDCFTHSIANFYKPKSATSDEVSLASIQLANRVIPYIQYDLLLKIEEFFESFQDDEYLEELCNEIESTYDNITDMLLVEANNVQKLLYHHIIGQVKNNSLQF